MKKISTVLGLSLMGLLFVAAGCYSSTATNSTKTTGTGDTISIANMSFSPTALTVKKGTTVTWTNNDSTVHTVTKDGATGPASGSLSKGQTYAFTFSETGTFTYHCSNHPFMTGTVTVTQ